MSTYTLAFKPAVGLYGQHDPSAVLFENGTPVFGIEEERLSRNKHGVGEFPSRAIQECLDHRDLSLSDLDRIMLPYDPRLRANIRSHYYRDALSVSGLTSKLIALERTLMTDLKSTRAPLRQIESKLEEIGSPLPPIELLSHHRCHAASAFHPSGFEDALVLTIDAKGEYDSTVIWRGDSEGLERVHTYTHPNSLGLLYAIVTEFLGYQMFNGEGKVMGLAPYGGPNEKIEARLRELIDTGVEYDVTTLTKRWGTGYGVNILEETFGRERNHQKGSFDQWEKDLAYVTQQLLEETVEKIVSEYLSLSPSNNVALAGGVALNCKMNRRIREMPAVDDTFIQPVAHDAGLALGAGWVDTPPESVDQLTDVYLGPSFKSSEIASMLETNKIEYGSAGEIERYVAERLADGALVGWFQGRMELGPRALGARSILADPRSMASRDRVNEFVKHRESWRPFAPSILEEAASDYLVDGEPAPFMIDTFEVPAHRIDDLAGVLHPADETTRPQTVNEEQHPRYYQLIREFYDITGVPAILNTSFNDHGEPIVNTPSEALKDFFGMGLDLLVLEDMVIEKQQIPPGVDVSREERAITTNRSCSSV